MFDAILDKFIQKAPITVMVRSLLENLLNPNKIDQWFESILTTQYTKSILFSAIVELMFTVVCKVRPNTCHLSVTMVKYKYAIKHEKQPIWEL